jgi:hypothetical protein
MKQEPFGGPKLEQTEKEAIFWYMIAKRAHVPPIPRTSSL